MSRVTVGFVRLRNTYFELGCYANAIDINDPRMQNKDMGCFYHLVELSGDKLNMSEYFKIAFRFAISCVSQDTNIFRNNPQMTNFKAGGFFMKFIQGAPIAMAQNSAITYLLVNTINKLSADRRLRLLRLYGCVEANANKMPTAEVPSFDDRGSNKTARPEKTLIEASYQASYRIEEKTNSFLIELSG